MSASRLSLSKPECSIAGGGARWLYVREEPCSAGAAPSGLCGTLGRELWRWRGLCRPAAGLYVREERCSAGAAQSRLCDTLVPAGAANSALCGALALTGAAIIGLSGTLRPAVNSGLCRLAGKPVAGRIGLGASDSASPGSGLGRLSHQMAEPAALCEESVQVGLDAGGFENSHNCLKPSS